MRRWAAVGVGLVLLGVLQGCSDRLADMQKRLEGTWVLQSRQLPNGTVLHSPQISGVLSWVPMNSRKAHITLSLLRNATEQRPRTFDYAASTFEISTSAITRSRYLLIRQGYRSSSDAPMTVYPKAKTEKGKISLENGVLRISHERGYTEVFKGNTMTASFPNEFVDTWKRIE